MKAVPRDVAEAAGDYRASRHFRVPSEGIRLEEEVSAFERRWLEAALAQAKGVKAEAARMLGLNKDRMKYLCRKYSL